MDTGHEDRVPPVLGARAAVDGVAVGLPLGDDLEGHSGKPICSGFGQGHNPSDLNATSGMRSSVRPVSPIATNSVSDDGRTQIAP